MRAAYNTKDGILRMLGSLESFNELIRMRKEAARTEHLDNFFILGRFFTHSSGHLIKCVPDFFPPEAYATIPPVLTPNEFEAFVNQFGVHKDETRRGHEMYLPAIPPARLVDPISKQGWTIQTCHDSYPVETDEEIELDPYVGQTIREVRKIFAAHPEKIYIFDPLRIFNADLMDMDDTMDASQDGSDGYMSREPGLRPEEDLRDDYVVQYGDTMDARVIQFFHENTREVYLNREHQSRIDTLAEMIQILCESRGFTGVEVEARPIPCHVINYEGKDAPSYLSWHTSAYFRVQTLVGTFGVIVIEDMSMCLDLAGTNVAGYELCDAIDVMVDKEYLHPHFCMIMPGIIEALCEKMSAS